MLVLVDAQDHGVGTGLADFCAEQQKRYMVRVQMRATLPETMFHRFQADAVAVGTGVDAGRHGGWGVVSHGLLQGNTGPSSSRKKLDEQNMWGLKR